MPGLVARAAPRCMRESGNLQQITRVDHSRLTLRYQSSPLQRVVDFKAELGDRVGMGRIGIEARRPGFEPLQHGAVQLLSRRQSASPLLP